MGDTAPEAAAEGQGAARRSGPAAPWAAAAAQPPRRSLAEAAVHEAVPAAAPAAVPAAAARAVRPWPPPEARTSSLPLPRRGGHTG